MELFAEMSMESSNGRRHSEVLFDVISDLPTHLYILFQGTLCNKTALFFQKKSQNGA